MNTKATQTAKGQSEDREKQLRLTGEQLDILWMKARTASGQEKTDLHKQLRLLREKQQADRIEHDAFKKDTMLLDQTSANQ
jgi:hypothetical protein